MRNPLLKSLLVVSLWICFGLEAFSQADVASPYSLFGVGQVRDNSMNVRLKGMGGVANAMMGGGLINSGNPASYAKIDSLAFLFDAGFYFKSSTFSTSNLSEVSNNASFNYVAMAFGVLPWWKMALGVQPYSTTGYTMMVDGYQPEIGSYATKFKGSGGLNEVFWGNAFKLGKHFSIGANAYYVFGNTQTETTLYFPDSLYRLGTRHSIDMTVNSFMFDYGVLFDTDLSDDMKLSVGLTYEQAINLKGKQTLFLRTFEEDADTEVEYVVDTIVYPTPVSSTIRMPQGFGAGIMLQKNDRWCVGADFNWRQWSKFRRQDVSDTLCDAWSISVGAEYKPRHSSVSGYFSKVSYRLGGFYQHGYLSLEGNDGQRHNINKVGATAGMSLPLPKTQSKVNVALEVGQYGTLAAGLIQERYIKMDVGVSVFETWFMKRKYR